MAIASLVASGRRSVSPTTSLVVSVAGMASIGTAGCVEVAGSSLGIIIIGGALASAGVMDSLVTTSTDL